MPSSEVSDDSRVTIWLDALPKWNSWLELIEARELAPEQPRNAWFYAQHHLYRQDLEDPYLEWRNQLQAPPVQPFLIPQSGCKGRASIAQWYPAGHPISWYISEPAFLNTMLVALLEEQVALNECYNDVYNMANRFAANVEPLFGLKVKATVQVPIATATGWHPMPRIGTEVEAFSDNDRIRSHSTAFRGYVQGLGPSGAEFVFDATMPEGLTWGYHRLMVSLLRTDTEMRAAYNAVKCAMVAPLAFEDDDFFSLKALMLSFRRPPSPSLYRRWELGGGVPPEERRYVNGILFSSLLRSLNPSQRAFYDTVVFGRAVNGLALLVGCAGSGKSSCLTRVTAALAAMRFKVLLVTKDAPTCDNLCTLLLRETKQREQVRRFFDESSWKICTARWGDESRRTPKKKMSEAEQAWTARAAVDEPLSDSRVVCTTVYSSEKLPNGTFAPDVVIFDESSVLTEPEICMPIIKHKQSVKKVVISGDLDQTKEFFASETRSPIVGQLAQTTVERVFDVDKELSMFKLKHNYRQHPQLRRIPQQTPRRGKQDDLQPTNVVEFG